jgi:hypothetical protein
MLPKIILRHAKLLSNMLKVHMTSDHPEIFMRRVSILPHHIAPKIFNHICRGHNPTKSSPSHTGKA